MTAVRGVGATRSWLDVGLVFAVALALRTAHALAVQGSVLSDLALGDAAVYLAWARAIRAGDWLGSEVFYQAPLYPYTLAAFQAAFGDGRTALLLGQAVLGSLGCAALVLAGRAWFDRRVGLVAGLVLAVDQAIRSAEEALGLARQAQADEVIEPIEERLRQYNAERAKTADP